MTKKQKLILLIVSLFTVMVALVCGYVLKVTYDAKSTVGKIGSDLDRQQRLVKTSDGQPMSLLLMGIDEGIVTGDLDRTKEYEGRSDSMMYATLNPQKEQATIVSLDRDLYVKMVGKKNQYGNNQYAKLNAAYAFGAEKDGKKGAAKMTIETIEDLLDVPVDHYISINMQGLKDLIDAIGGIEVDNKYHFELDGVELKPGKQHLDGEKGLAYARFREYDPKTKMGDPAGDMGRQKRQRQVVEIIANKLLSLDTLANYQKIFKAVEKNVETDLSWDEMIDLATGYTSVTKNIVPKQLQGQYHWFDGYYQILAINNLLDIQNTLKEQLGKPQAKTLPNLKTLDPNEYYFDDTHLDPDAGIRDGIDNKLYFDGHILKPDPSIWTKNKDKKDSDSESSSNEETSNFSNNESQQAQGME